MIDVEDGILVSKRRKHPHSHSEMTEPNFQKVLGEKDALLELGHEQVKVLREERDLARLELQAAKNENLTLQKNLKKLPSPGLSPMSNLISFNAGAAPVAQKPQKTFYAEAVLAEMQLKKEKNENLKLRMEISRLNGLLASKKSRSLRDCRLSRCHLHDSLSNDVE
ncbi:hypothetical protein BJ912DRAFT_1058813 [Pholiota molesta]|nr:hypothetical protein BJ912DRAFT_1058813 [Pholiota molesta]